MRLLLFLLLLWTIPGFADFIPNKFIQTDRYTLAKVAIDDGQANPMKTIISINYPPVVKTVGQGIRYTLERTGYRLAKSLNSDPKMTVLLDLPFPEVQRNLGPLSVTQVLKTLAGPAFELVIDPVHRLVSFDLIADYQYQKNN